jgi:hypothetical protein
MTWWELFGVLVGAGGLVASIFGAWITYAARWNGERTRELVREIHADTRALLDRMDQRADERHREVVRLVAAIRGEEP